MLRASFIVLASQQILPRGNYDGKGPGWRRLCMEEPQSVVPKKHRSGHEIGNSRRGVSMKVSIEDGKRCNTGRIY